MPRTVKLISPPGYGVIAPVDRQRHAGLGIRPGLDYRWCQSLNAVFVNAGEFGKAALDYPIAFARDERSGEFVPVAVLGLRPKQNLFVDDHGQWRAQRYIPAYFRRYPFCIAEVPQPNGAAAQQMVCVQEDQLAPASLPLFGKDGAPTAAWAPVMRLLEAIENARQQTRVLTRRLEALGLLTAFDAVAMPSKGKPLRLQGLFRVDEEKLQQISTRDLRTLLRKGELRAVHAHLLSLANIDRVSARLNDREQAEAASGSTAIN